MVKYEPKLTFSVSTPGYIPAFSSIETMERHLFHKVREILIHQDFFLFINSKFFVHTNIQLQHGDMISDIDT